MEDPPQTGQSGPAEIEVEVGPAGGSERRRFRPGSGRRQWFKDLDIGPEMVVVPAGSFTMGTDSDTYGYGSKTERPAHRVTFAEPFAIGRFAITFDEWDAAFARGGAELRQLPDFRGWGRGRLPAFPLSWDDGQDYVSWLSEATGRAYRLPSEAEWEYAARAGARTRYWWGEDFSYELANVAPPALSHWQVDRTWNPTVPVDCFEPNPWGLYQVHGNVSEWCQDAYRRPDKGYRGAPTDGSEWIRSDQSCHVNRGGGSGSHPDRARVTKRQRNRAGNRCSGIRVARTLEL